MRKIILVSIKVLLAIMLLNWLYERGALTLNNSAFGFTFNVKTLSLIAASSILLSLGAILISLRTWRLLNLLKIIVGFKESLQITFASMSLGLMLPGLVGVDALRISYFCLKEPSRKIDVVSCVIADRVIGLYALLSIATLAAIFAHLSKHLISIDLLVILLTLFLMVSLSIALMSSNQFIRMRPVAIIHIRLPEVFKKIIEALQVLGSHRKDMLWLLLVSMISQGITVFSFIVMGLIIGDSLSLVAHFMLDSMAMFFNLVPITPGGLGITESVFAYLYQLNGSDNGAIIALLGRLNQYWVYVLIGLPAIFCIDLRSLIRPKDQIKACAVKDAHD